MKYLEFILLILLLAACSAEPEFTLDKYEVTLRKSILPKIEDYEIKADGIEIERGNRPLPCGSNRIELYINKEDEPIILVWNDEVRAVGKFVRSYFSYEEVDEFWIGSVQLDEKEMESKMSDSKFRNEILMSRKSTNLEYMHDLPTFCTDYLMKNMRIGFQRVLFQRICYQPSPVDMIHESRYVLLNALVYYDLKNKGYLSPNDTVFVTNKKTEKTIQMTLSDERLEFIREQWKRFEF